MSEAYKPLDPETMTRSPGLTYQELLDQDSKPVPEVLRLESPMHMGYQECRARYTSREWHEREKAHSGKRYGSSLAAKRTFLIQAIIIVTTLRACRFWWFGPRRES